MAEIGPKEEEQQLEQDRVSDWDANSDEEDSKARPIKKGKLMGNKEPQTEL